MQIGWRLRSLRRRAPPPAGPNAASCALIEHARKNGSVKKAAEENAALGVGVVNLVADAVALGAGAERELPPRDERCHGGRTLAVRIERDGAGEWTEVARDRRAVAFSIPIL